MSRFDPSDAPPTPQERRAVRRPGADVIYRVRRASSPSPAAPVVFLHGLASNMTRWAELTRETTLGEHHDLIRVDLRGHGESMTRRRFDLSVWSDDLAQLLTEEHATRAYLVGHSLGATLAMAFAAARPDRVAGLVLIDPVFREALVPGTRRTTREMARCSRAQPRSFAPSTGSACTGAGSSRSIWNSSIGKRASRSPTPASLKPSSAATARRGKTCATFRTPTTCRTWWSCSVRCPRCTGWARPCSCFDPPSRAIRTRLLSIDGWAS
jgi:pimeloyl-ACP methyl ester carboxylesterase